ncbi:MAG: YqgE/AlgH family protein [Myxococcales bacterium]|nr:YqgE/AlgH family protein [Myxococcales bacterium]
MPGLLDPNFFRAVVALCAHTREGAFGVVVNQELQIPVSAICNEAGLDWNGDDTARVYCGGPVERQRGWLLHDSAQRFDGTQLVDRGLAITTSQGGLAAYGQDPAGRYRLALGYAGWGEGQLDREIAQGSWLTAPLDPAIIFDTPNDQIWARALALVGVDPARLVDAGSHIN